MTEPDKLRIRPLDDKSDYALWRIRIQAAISAKGLEEVFEEKKADNSSSDNAEKPTKSLTKAEQCQQASNLIVSALGDHALRVVRTVIGKPNQMMEKLDARYDSKTISSRISKMSELVSVRYSTLRDDIDKHIDKMAGLIEQLRSMGSTFDEALAIGILVASITVPDLLPATAAIKTLTEKDATWELVSGRLIEEVKNLKSNNRNQQSNAANSSCAICGKPNHSTPKCFLNPLNPNNRLNLKNSVADIPQGGKAIKDTGKKESPDGKLNKRNKKGKNKERAAMARPKHENRKDQDVDKMMLDSGTTTHITSKIYKVTKTTSANIKIKLADDSSMMATAKGTREVNWKTEDGNRKVHLSNTLVAPHASMSLLSVPSLVAKNIAVLFVPGNAVFIDLEDDFSILGYATQEEDGLFYVEDNQDVIPNINQGPSMKSMMAIVKKHASVEMDTEDTDENGENDDDSDANSTTSGDTEDTWVTRNDVNDDSRIWHLRLGHAKSVQAIKNLVRNGELPHVACHTSDCDVCAKGKFRREFKGSLTSETEVGRLHVDTKGKVDTTSVNGHKYFLTIIDEYSRYAQTYPMKSKGEASQLLLNFIRKLEKQSGHTVKKVHTDNGTEITRALDYLDKQGVEVTTTTPYTPESNGLVERTHGVILSIVRSCLVQSKLDQSYWNYALRHATDCRNFVPHSKTGKTPYEIIFGQQSPNLRHMRPFGCRSEFRPNAKRIDVFGPRVQSGLNMFHEGGGVYHILTCEGVVRTKHVKFFEQEFPGTVRNHHLDKEDTESDKSYSEDTCTTSVEFPVTDDSSRLSDTSYENESDKSPSECNGDSVHESSESETEKSNADTDNEQENDQEKFSQEVTQDVSIDNLTYVPSEPSKYRVTPEPSDKEDESGNVRDDNNTSGYSLRPLERKNYSMAALPDEISTSDEPKVSTAMKSDEKDYWQEAIDEEIKTLIDNDTWTTEEKPPSNAKILPAMIILKLKRNKDGNPARFKARVVALGNFQDEFGNTVEMYAPVICIELVRALLSVMLHKGWNVKHLDIKGAFLHAYLIGEEIWIRLPYIPGHPFLSGRLVRLRKSLYGLRQAPKLWYDYLYNELKKLGFVRSSSSECLFLLCSSVTVTLVVYVDDVLLFGKDEDIESVARKLKKIFTVTDLGRCSHFLGIKVDFRQDGVFLSQSAYVQKIVEAANMSSAKPSKYPLPIGHPLYEKVVDLTETEATEMESIPFRKVLGALLFLSTRTRPDISTAVSMIAKFQSKPAIKHWKMVKNVVRYLIGTADYGILLPKWSKDVEVLCWTDADWARDLSNRRSRTGFLVTVNGGPVIWTSKLQSCTAQSTAEAEFNALSHAIREVKWLRLVLGELKAINDGYPTQVLQDNLGSISWTEDINGLRKVKHVGIKYHFVRDCVESKIVKVGYTPSPDNRSDSLTKVVIGADFIKHRLWLGVTN